MVAAPWAKPVQYQLNDEELKIEIGGQTEEELENEEQWCGAPECNQRWETFSLNTKIFHMCLHFDRKWKS